MLGSDEVMELKNEYAIRYMTCCSPMELPITSKLNLKGGEKKWVKDI